jgi:hypothetical protein
MHVHRKQFLIALNILLIVRTGPKVLHVFGAKIVAILTSGLFHAKFSTFALPATKNEPYSMLNT